MSRLETMTVQMTESNAHFTTVLKGRCCSVGHLSVRWRAKKRSYYEGEQL